MRFFRGVARKEYVLSAGAFHSPQLLMLSGIGDPEILKQHNIRVQHALKHVGKNLIDNGAVLMKYEAKNFSIGQSVPVALIATADRLRQLQIQTCSSCSKWIVKPIISSCSCAMRHPSRMRT
jgi:choline dehydrogenase-like flavoprotein